MNGDAERAANEPDMTMLNAEKKGRAKGGLADDGRRIASGRADHADGARARGPLTK